MAVRCSPWYAFSRFRRTIIRKLIDIGLQVFLMRLFKMTCTKGITSPKDPLCELFCSFCYHSKFTDLLNISFGNIW